MMLKKILISVAIILIQGNLFAQRFTAYYTMVAEHYDVLAMVEDKLFGKYADLIVEVNDLGKVYFTRETSYLPVWKTNQGSWNFEEIVPRHGDGKKDRPDIISRYSHVRLIKNSENEIVVHWRYFPDFGNVQWDGVVDEYFRISPQGKVVRSVRRGTEKIYEWKDPVHTIFQAYELTPEGITSASYEPSASAENAGLGAINSAVKIKKKRNPLLEFPFDEGLDGYSESATEIKSGRRIQIAGPKAYWKKGVSGSALAFDGYYSSLKITKPFSANKADNLTVEGWFALAAYPFGWAPIVQQAEWGERGFYLGINDEGYPGFHCEVNGQWISVVDSSRLGLFKWYHVAAVFSGDDRTVSLFVNGQPAAARQVAALPLIFSDSILTVGLNREKMPAIEGRIRIGKWPSLFGLDGLIDEIRIYDKAFTAAGIKGIYKEINTGVFRPAGPDISRRHFPNISTGAGKNGFEAVYASLKYHESWDNLWRVSDHPDVVVSFDNSPAKLVFWRGTSYGPFFVTENGRWVGDQSNEDYRLIDHPGDAEGCLEHMSDKQCRHSYVQIIENTDARILIHWRYGLVDSRYLFAPGVDGWGGWTDEYWTIYPDGVAVRYLPRGIVFGDGWVETMFLSEPGTIPEDNVHLQAFTAMNRDGEIEKLCWENGSPESKLENPVVTMVNSKSEYKMFNVFPTGSGIEIFAGHNDRSHFHWWNHWPVSQITSDGRGAKAADRMAHSSLSWGAPSANYLMYGITEKPIEDQLTLAKSWNHPPDILELKGASGGKYAHEERAYHLNAASSDIEFVLAASSDSPAFNPAFVINNWSGQDIKVKINGEEKSRDDNCRYGFVDQIEGKNLIVWLEREFESNIKIEFIN